MMMPDKFQDKIVFFVLNYLALEGAQRHFKVQLPADNEAIEFDKGVFHAFSLNLDLYDKVKNSLLCLYGIRKAVKN